VIPSVVTQNGVPYTITTISPQAFQSKRLTSVVFPPTITHIPDLAFANNYIHNIEITNPHTTFGLDPFRFNLLKYITVPEGTAEVMKNRLTPYVMGSDNVGTILREGTTPLYQYNLMSSGTNWFFEWTPIN